MRFENEVKLMSDSSLLKSKSDSEQWLRRHSREKDSWIYNARKEGLEAVKKEIERRKLNGKV